MKSQRTGGSAGREGDGVDAVMANSSRVLRVELMCEQRRGLRLVVGHAAQRHGVVTDWPAITNERPAFKCNGMALRLGGLRGRRMRLALASEASF